MGDHHIGVAMGRAAEIFWGLRGSKSVSKDEALEFLDNICIPYKGRDAEFESVDINDHGQLNPNYADYTDPNGPIGRLIIIAFDATLEEMVLDDNDTSPWFDGPYMRFRDRYNFC